ncbi:MAG: DUF4139 domain-containing protein [Pseudomonadota bacterium]
MLPRNLKTPAVAAGLLLTTASAATIADTAVTIYSKATPGAVNPDLYRPTANSNSYFGQSIPGYAIVRDQIEIELPAGRSSFALTDVAALIDPTTVRFESLTDPDGTRVIEQDFRFDLVGTQKLLNRYVDQQITVEQLVGDGTRSTTGTLLSTDGGLVLQRDDGGIDVLTQWQNISLSALPGGLMTRPTLVWDVTASRSGNHDARISYETAGTTWWADYNLVWKPQRSGNSGELSVGAWVSIINRSGADFEDAQLKLVAGDVQRAPQASARFNQMALMATRAIAEDAAGFDQKAFFEFHLYTLGRSVTLPNNATKQIELFAQAEAVPAEKKLVFNGLNTQGIGYGVNDPNFGAQSNSKVDVYLEFENVKRAGLGVPFPAGRIRVSQLDEADDALEFIGEDVITHTPRNEEVRIRLGSSFDVIGERVQRDYAIDTRARWLEETVEITITNRKDIEQQVTIAEPLYRHANWTISDQTDRYRKIDSRLVHFVVDVAADSERVVSYKVRYTW